jgi:hypothetical protein
MGGAIVLTVAMLVMIPLVLVVGGALFAFVGWAAKEDVEREHEGSEFIDLNR